MRTTLTLDEDVAERLQAEVRRTGRSFKETVNELLRLALLRPPATAKRKPFKLTTFKSGGVRPEFAGMLPSDILKKLDDEEDASRHPGLVKKSR